MIYALWFGGSSYSHGDLTSDLEKFPSQKNLLEMFYCREHYGYSQRQNFDYANRPAENVYTPVVEYYPTKEDRETVGYIWRDAEEIDGVHYVSEYPDKIVTIGVRGGYRIENA